MAYGSTWGSGTWRGKLGILKRFAFRSTDSETVRAGLQQVGPADCPQKLPFLKPGLPVTATSSNCFFHNCPAISLGAAQGSSHPDARVQARSSRSPCLLHHDTFESRSAAHMRFWNHVAMSVAPAVNFEARRCLRQGCHWTFTRQHRPHATCHSPSAAFKSLPSGKYSLSGR